MSETAEKILDAAEELVMTRGYNAFSYHDIAPQLGIKTASIHYHFPTKEQLGVAVVRRYTQRVADLQRTLDEDDSLDEPTKLDRYFEIFLEVAADGLRICLCGALAGEFNSLPAPLQSVVAAFFELHETWLTKVLSAGKRRGTFAFEGSPKAMAKLVFSSLEGALLVSRSRADPRSFRSALTSLKRILSA